MASETIYGYFGRKGAGKTHELIRVICDRLREGRHVVAVVPTLDVAKVAAYLADETVLKRLVVKDYTDLEEDPKFWPDEHLIRRLQMWKHGEALPEGFEKWRESVVLPGSFVVIDEAWRWLESAKTIPKGLKAALHMARHWHGPMFWNKPELLEQYARSDWFPSMGGSEFDTAPAGQMPLVHPGDWEQLEDGSYRRYRGGDGTPICTTNILFASQDFFGLARGLRAQIDQCTQLVAVRDDYFPSLLKKATDGKEQYMAYTFESADMPTRRQMLSAMEKGEKLWLSEQVVTHDPQIHELKSYATGYARENRVDNKADLANNPHWKKIKRQGIIMLVMFVAMIGISLWAAKGVKAGPTLGGSSTNVTKSSAVGGLQDSATAVNQGIATQREAVEVVSYGYAGKVGKTIALDAGGTYAYISRDQARIAGGGRYVIEFNGGIIDSETDVAQDRGGASRNGATGPGVQAGSGAGGSRPGDPVAAKPITAGDVRALSERAAPRGG